MSSSTDTTGGPPAGSPPSTPERRRHNSNSNSNNTSRNTRPATRADGHEPRLSSVRHAARERLEHLQSEQQREHHQQQQQQQEQDELRRESTTSPTSDPPRLGDIPPGTLEGPLTPSGERQTLQEFLQSLDHAGRASRQERTAGQHRHSMGDFGGDMATNTAAAAVAMNAGTGRHGRTDRASRRRSTPLVVSSAVTEDFSAYPTSPPPSYQRGNYQGPGLASPDREPHPGRRISVGEANLNGSIYLKPRWQPDAEADSCPICGRLFGFFFRKHHCRKCGRVVCAACSPHRITIPRQYIVEPPAEGSEGEIGETLRVEAGSGGAEDEANAPFGGQEVRLCNPCVPDPNPLPPPDYLGSRSPNATAQSILPTFPHHGFENEQEQQIQVPPIPSRSRYPRRASSQREWITPYGTQLNSGSSGNSRPEYARQRSSTDPHHGRFPSSPTGLRSPSQHYRSSPHHTSSPSSVDHVAARTQALGLHPAIQRHHSTGHRHRSQSSLGAPPHPGALPFGNPRDAPLPPLPTQQQQQRPPPRRIIPEEDECPICHDELPPRGPSGEEDSREAHVSRCIEEQMVASGAGRSIPSSRPPPPPAGGSASMPASEVVAGGGASSAPNSSVLGASSSSSTATASRPRAGTHASASMLGRRANMLVYHASEKDCLDAEGRQKECVICLEDFVVGAELGRLECWCVFHRSCIREWWDTKGLGACPTHQHGI